MRRVCMLLLILSIYILLGNVNAQISFNKASQKQMVLQNFSSMPLSFIENRGQWNEKVLFKAEAGGARFYFSKDEVVYLFVRDIDELVEEDAVPFSDMVDLHDKLYQPRNKKEILLIKAKFIDANPDVKVIGEDCFAYYNNYFIGNDPSKWHSNVPSYSSVVFKDIYTGIDLKYYGDSYSMKYDFIVQPGADISQIKIHYKGMEDLGLTPDGKLQVETSFGLIQEEVPYIYQEIGGTKQELRGRYEIIEPGVFGFEINSDHDPSYPIIIDPILGFSTYYGGGLEDWSYSVALDNSLPPYVYITGRTWSSDFPVDGIYEAYEDLFYGLSDVFICKLDPSGSQLIYGTYLGGYDDDWGYGITIDDQGYAYVAGRTYSSNFPCVGAYQPDPGGNFDAFVTKIAQDGSDLIYSTYLGGSSYDVCHDIAVDNSNQAYLTGMTYSTDFPVEGNYYQGQNDGYWDAFITKFSSSGDQLLYSTFLGGSYIETAYGITLDNSGDAYIVGWTWSDDFDLSANPYQTSLRGQQDAFFAKLSTTNNTLYYSTYFGGEDKDYGKDIVLDSENKVYITGWTRSDSLPIVNAVDEYLDGLIDAFVTKFSIEDNSLLYSTYLGGDNDDCGYGIAVDNSARAYVTGRTESSNFPTVGNIFLDYSGMCDVFLTEFDDQGNSLIYSTYYGGDDNDWGYDIGLFSLPADLGYLFYLTGKTGSDNLPNAIDSLTSYKGNFDAFVSLFATAEIESLFAVIDSIVPDSTSFGETVTFGGHGEYNLDIGFAAYNWSSDIDGFLSDLPSFSTSELSVGTHAIHFRVQLDSLFVWSEYTIATVEITADVNPPPRAVIDSIVPNPADSGETVTFGGHGEDLPDEGRANLQVITYYDYDPFRFGDINTDGWCNIGDLIACAQVILGNRSLDEVCAEAGDVNGDGTPFMGSDFLYLWHWLCNPPHDPPVNECTDPVLPTSSGGQILLYECCWGDPGDTIYQDIYLEGIDLLAFNFSLAYDNQDIDTIFLYSHDPSFNDWEICTLYRENKPPENNDTLNTVTFLFSGDVMSMDNKVSFPTLTEAITLEIVISPDADNLSHFPLIPEADPYNGPPRFYVDDQNWTEPVVEQQTEIIGYNWRSDIDGQLSDTSSFSKSDLSPGNHTIYFKVQDSDSAWSNETSENLHIVKPYEEKWEVSWWYPEFGDTLDVLMHQFYSCTLLVTNIGQKDQIFDYGIDTSSRFYDSEGEMTIPEWDESLESPCWLNGSLYGYGNVLMDSITADETKEYVFKTRNHWYWVEPWNWYRLIPFFTGFLPGVPVALSESYSVFFALQSILSEHGAPVIVDYDYNLMADAAANTQIKTDSIWVRPEQFTFYWASFVVGTIGSQFTTAGYIILLYIPVGTAIAAGLFTAEVYMFVASEILYVQAYDYVGDYGGYVNPRKSEEIEGYDVVRDSIDEGCWKNIPYKAIELYSITEAACSSYLKCVGALKDGSTEWAAKQLAATYCYTKQQSSILQEINQAAYNIISNIDTPDSEDVEAIIDSLEEGLPDIEVEIMELFNLDTAGIAQIFLDAYESDEEPNICSSFVNLPPTLDTLSTSLIDLVSDLCNYGIDGALIGDPVHLSPEIVIADEVTFCTLWVEIPALGLPVPEYGIDSAFVCDSNNNPVVDLGIGDNIDGDSIPEVKLVFSPYITGDGKQLQSIFGNVIIEDTQDTIAFSTAALLTVYYTFIQSALCGGVRESENFESIDGVQVKVYPDSSYTIAIDSTYTNEDGEFCFALNDSTYYVEFKKPNYLNERSGPLEVVPNETTEVCIVMNPLVYGRCCYGDFYNQDCVDSVTEYGCSDIYNSADWTANESCITLPCPEYPGFAVAPNNVIGYVEFPGPGNQDIQVITVNNIGSGTLTFSASVSIDNPSISTSIDNIFNPGSPAGFSKKSIHHSKKENVASLPKLDIGIILQGGDNCSDYFNLGSAVPVSDGGSTVGYNNDYGPFDSRPDCWQGSWYSLSSAAPDVVYKFTAPTKALYNFSLCSSNYDSGLLLYNFTCPDEPLYPDDFICGNDDACGPQSELTNISLIAGQEILIVVGGYYNNAGDYELIVSSNETQLWLSIDTNEGTIPPGGPGIDINVIMDAAELDCGIYDGNIDFTTNDPLIPSFNVPVTFYVCETPGYEYFPGDVNMALGIWPPSVIGGDVTYLVGYFIGGGQAACLLDGFWASADINGDCVIIGGDVTALVGYFVAGGSITHCPDYPPLWLTPDDLPDIAPDGWPNCDTPVINSRVIPTGSVK